MNRVCVTVLVENTAGGHTMLAEHGLALWIEAGSRRILFDTGQTGILRHNARELGIDLGSADALVLSHGHYDHTGGLSSVPLSEGSRRAASGGTGTREPRPLRVFAHTQAFADKYARNADGSSRSIGMPSYVRQSVPQRTELIHTDDGPAELFEGVSVTGAIPRRTDFEDTGGPFFRDAQCNQPDELVDDQATFIDTLDGVVVILGCAHAGLINTLHYIRSLVGQRPIHAVIGGMHLVSANNARLDRTVEALRGFGGLRLYPMHCTGFAAASRLWKEFPDRTLACHAGSRLSFG